MTESISKAHAEALKLYNGGKWMPGAYTSARCHLWNNMDGKGRDILDEWIAKEKDYFENHDLIKTANHIPTLKDILERFKS